MIFAAFTRFAAWAYRDAHCPAYPSWIDRKREDLMDWQIAQLTRDFMIQARPALPTPEDEAFIELEQRAATIERLKMIAASTSKDTIPSGQSFEDYRLAVEAIKANKPKRHFDQDFLY